MALEFRLDSGARQIVMVRVDNSVAPKRKSTSVKVLGTTAGGETVLVDAYPSRAGGMSLCQAGTERFLRVISTRHAPPRELFSLKVESCRDNIELASPGIEWNAPSSEVRIHWLSGPAATGVPEGRLIHIGPAGRIEQVQKAD